ncbi:hypothetical protein D0865_09414 [Hortaea werneckii]|uniref:Uncharacterized protein n=1 Tax=Hortaea werneckii TaxID=91943 RepID=A0A3M7C2G5_HORWE|nr:hypothetical protein D0865_09414 [Hortaea werneckii]
MALHAKIFAAAVKYQVPGLRTLAAEKFREAVRGNWHHETFAEAARIAYETTYQEERALRDTVTATLDRHGNALLKKDEIKAFVKNQNDLIAAESALIPPRIQSLCLVVPTAIARYRKNQGFAQVGSTQITVAAPISHVDVSLGVEGVVYT